MLRALILLAAAGLALRADLPVHHRFGDSSDSEDMWSPEISAGEGYHF